MSVDSSQLTVVSGRRGPRSILHPSRVRHASRSLRSGLARFPPSSILHPPSSIPYSLSSIVYRLSSIVYRVCHIPANILVRKLLVHFEGRDFCRRGDGDILRRNARDSAVRRNRVEHDAAGGDLGPRPISQIFPAPWPPAPISTPCLTLGCRSPVSLPVPPSVTSCSNETLSSMTRRFTDHDSRGMVDQDARSDLRGRMDIDGEDLGEPVLQMDGEQVPPSGPEPVATRYAWSAETP